jgi:hypothetical protein
MLRQFAAALGLGLMVTAGATAFAADDAATDARTMTGWFSDAQCALPRAAKGIIAPNNPGCVKKCLREGATAVFISEQAKAAFEVRDYPSVAADVGWHVEVTGTVDETGKLIAISSVKRLSEHFPSCALPRKPGARTTPSPTSGPTPSPTPNPTPSQPGA